MLRVAVDKTYVFGFCLIYCVSSHSRLKVQDEAYNCDMSESYAVQHSMRAAEPRIAMQKVAAIRHKTR